MEQRLIAEGMPETEIKNLCDVHVQVFKEALEHKTVPGLPAGHPVHTFMLENRAAEDILKQLAEIKDFAKEQEMLLQLLDRLSEIDKHYLRKENQLFPIIETKGITGPSKVMWALHDDIRHFIKDVRKRATDNKMEKVAIEALVKMVNDMIYKEEHILFPMALETLSEDEWAKVRKGEEEIGYAWIKPEADWKPAAGSFQQELLEEKVGSLNLNTGQLTAEQVNLMLMHLPDRYLLCERTRRGDLLFSNAGADFPAKPGRDRTEGPELPSAEEPRNGPEDTGRIPGRQAQLSPTSGSRCTGKFLLIKYFAVRDGQGAYRGCLEVSQDVTEIRKLEGQKRLLDWS